jgi:SNF2 family DNA or RNA helicase
MKELQAKKINVAEIHGSTSAKMKQLAVRRWNAGELQVVVGQIASMGVSLNMQDGGNHIVCVEQDWSPDIMDQFYARLLRMGQKRNVHADIFSGGTKLEEAVARIAGRKSREHKRVLS